GDVIASAKSRRCARFKIIATCNATATEQRAGFMCARQIAREDANQKGTRMDRRNNRTTAEIQRKPVTFSRDELWLLHDFVRQELPESRQWRFPPASEELNEEIVLALDACETHELPEYTLLLSKGDMLVLDFFVRRDHRRPEGASGKSSLLKIFRARSERASA